ncbi:unnamed protein product [Paramecium primaurelia]|uniref:Uncharacterized protein n=1 Tax=Paramecium primaurelia TaxID=5886 RepID=A0A8S1NTC6_PARPR|nr:unnamed protein product [Paramecium primaurelia]
MRTIKLIKQIPILREIFMLGLKGPTYKTHYDTLSLLVFKADFYKIQA